MNWRFWRERYARNPYKGKHTIQTMKRMIDSHLQNFAWETMNKDKHDAWILVLKDLLEQYRQVRGR